MTCHRIVMQDAWRRSVFIFGLRTGRKEFKQSLYFISCLSLLNTLTRQAKPGNEQRAAPEMK